MPAFSVSLICGDPPGTTDALDVDNTQLVVPFGVPRPRPTGPADPRAVSWTVTAPAVDTVKVEKLDPPTVNELLKMSVVVDDGLVDENRSPMVPQPAQSAARARAIRT